MIAVPTLTRMPALGAWPTTSPGGTTGSNTSVRVPGVSLAVMRSWKTSASVLFLQVGYRAPSRARPRRSARSGIPSRRPCPAACPGPGPCRAADGSGWVADWTAVRPFCSARAWASANVRPTKVGTVTRSAGGVTPPPDRRLEDEEPREREDQDRDQPGDPDERAVALVLVIGLAQVAAGGLRAPRVAVRCGSHGRRSFVVVPDIGVRDVRDGRRDWAAPWPTRRVCCRRPSRRRSRRDPGSGVPARNASSAVANPPPTASGRPAPARAPAG